MRKPALIAILGMAMAGLSACGSSGYLDRERPDEFAVTRNAPLVIPPDFALLPPAPGAPRASEADSSTQALQAMFGGPSARSTVESGVVNQAGSTRASPGIRSDVGDPKTDVVDKGAVTRDIIAAPEGDGQEARANVPK